MIHPKIRRHQIGAVCTTHPQGETQSDDWLLSWRERSFADTAPPILTTPSITTQPDPRAPLQDELATLSSFLPVALIERANGGLLAGHQEAISHTNPTIALFADISGFTALSEKLNQMAGMGAEKLTEILNRYFGFFLNQIERQGGDVVKFAGDALLAIWTCESDKEMPAAAASAIECAEILQAWMKASEAGRDPPLRMKIAISAGEINVACLGGILSRKEMVLTGAPLAELGIANDLAQPQDIVLCPSVKRWIDGTFLNNRMLTALAGMSQEARTPAGQDAENFYLLQRLNSAEVTLATALNLRKRPVLLVDRAEDAMTFIPYAIRARIHAGQTDWLNENRRVSVVCVNLTDFTSELPLKVAQTAMAAMQKALYRFEGSLNKISVDDKGVTLMGVLGMPPFGHTDDPERAVLAALAIETALNQLELACSIGVCTGLVYCGVVGNTRRREYTMMGDSVNTAARLMKQASRFEDSPRILVDECTARAVGNALPFEALEPLVLKGKSKALSVFRPQGEQSSSTSGSGVLALRTSSFCIGRTLERELIQDFVSRRPVAGQTLILRGQAGSGRRTLMEHAMPIAQRKGLKIIKSRAEAILQQTPLHVWQPVFTELLMPAGSQESAAQHIERISAMLQPLDSIKAYLCLLDFVLPLDWPDTPEVAALSATARADALIELLGTVLQFLCAESPVCLGIQDLEWADALSIRLMKILSEKQLPVMVIATLNADRETERVKTFCQNKALILLNLPGMIPEDLYEIAAKNLGVEAIPAEAKNIIIERAAGSPLFSIQIVKALQESGWIKTQADGQASWCSERASKQESLPDSIDQLLISRIDQLPPAVQLTGKVASVLGEHPKISHVSDIHPQKPGRIGVLEHLVTMQSKDLLNIYRDDKDENHSGLVFRNESVTKAFYNLIPQAQQGALHLAAAQHLKTSGNRQDQSHLATLVFHLTRAIEHLNNSASPVDPELMTETLECLMILANRATRIGASAEAEARYTEALTLIDCARSTKTQTSTLISTTNNTPESNTAIAQNAVQWVEFEIDALLGYSAVRSAQHGWGDAQASAALERARQQAKHTKRKILVFQALRGLWQVRVANSDYDDAKALGKQLIEIARNAQGDPDQQGMLAEAQRVKGTTYFWIGEFDKAKRDLESALHLDAEQPSARLQDQSRINLTQDTEVSARGILAWTYALLGLRERAIEEAHRAVQLSEHDMPAFTQAYALGTAMWTALHISDQAMAKHYAERTYALSSEKGFDYFSTAAKVIFGWAKAWDGDETGIDDIRNAITAWRSRGVTMGVPAFQLQLARALKKLGRIDEMNEVLEDPIYKDSLPKEPWIVHLSKKMLNEV